MIFIPLISICLIVGTIIGITGIGGILVIPSLAFFGNLETHVAMSTSLASFLVGAIVATYSYWRMGFMDWKLATPLCIGGLLFAYLGAWVNSGLPTVPLNTMLALLILFAGVSALRPWTAFESLHVPSSSYVTSTVFFIGGSTGFIAGLTGAGGPILSIPMMIMLGFPPVVSVAVAMPYQIMTAFSGTIGNVVHGKVDFAMLVPITIAQVVCIFLGARMAPYIPAQKLKLCIGLLCLAVGSFILYRTWL